MAVDIFMEYAAIERAARTFEQAGQTYSDMVDKLRVISDNLSEQCLVGQTGNAAAAYIEQVIDHLNGLGMQAFAMRDALMATVAQFRTEIDPQIAGTFEAA
jgi:hypothetical protein